MRTRRCRNRRCAFHFVQDSPRPKAPGEPEAAATVETTALTVELTAVQYADLEREAARVYRDIEPRYLTEAPATVLLNSRVQKHWRTLVGK